MRNEAECLFSTAAPRIGRLFIQRFLCAAVKCETNCSHTYSYNGLKRPSSFVREYFKRVKTTIILIFFRPLETISMHLFPNALIGLSQNLNFIQCLCEGFSLHFVWHTVTSICICTHRMCREAFRELRPPSSTVLRQ